MRKKLLKLVPLPIVDISAIREALLDNKSLKSVVVLQKEKVDKTDTLVFNIYRCNEKNKKNVFLLFRLYCQKEDYITLDVEKNTWRTGSLLNLTCRDSGWSEYWWNYGQITYLNENDVEVSNNFFAKLLNVKSSDFDNSHPFRSLDKYQNIIKNNRLEKKHRKITDVIDHEMEKFGELPKDYAHFVDEAVFRDENYIFYNTKEKIAYCTSCKYEFEVKDKHLRHKTIGIWNNRDIVKHNHAVTCPYCHKNLLCKSDGMGRNNLISIGWSVLVQKYMNNVHVRYFCHTKDFRGDFREPKVMTTERYRTIHTKDTQIDYMWDKFKSTHKRRWCYYRDRYNCFYMQPAEVDYPRSTMLYNTSLQDVVEGTCLQYSVPDLFIENVVKKSSKFTSPWMIDNYFSSYRKHPFLEQFLKIGFFDMVGEYLCDYRGDEKIFNNGRSSILGSLGINKYQFQMLRKVGNPRIKDVEILRYKPDLKWEEFESLRYIQDNGYNNMYKMYIDFMKYTTIHKLTRYIYEKKINYPKDYFDYAQWLEEMDYDMKNSSNLFPKNFKSAHDEASKQYMKFKDKKEREAVKRFNQMLKKLEKESDTTEAMNLELYGLFIKLPNRLEDLKKEGEVLHHCVGTYMDKVAAGKTMIFFIRQRSEPEKPYYTLEWNDNHVVQCRGVRNCDMTEDVKAFTKLFEKKMIEEVAKERKDGKWKKQNLQSA